MILAAKVRVSVLKGDISNFDNKLLKDSIFQVDSLCRGGGLLMSRAHQDPGISKPRRAAECDGVCISRCAIGHSARVL